MSSVNGQIPVVECLDPAVTDTTSPCRNHFNSTSNFDVTIDVHNGSCLAQLKKAPSLFTVDFRPLWSTCFTALSSKGITTRTQTEVSYVSRTIA